MPTPTRKSRGSGSPVARACVSMPHICETDAGCRQKCKGLFKTINMARERSQGSEFTRTPRAPWNISKRALSGDKAARFVSGWCRVSEQTRGWKDVSAGITVRGPAVSIPFNKRFKPNSCSKHLIYCLCFHSNTAVKSHQAARLPYLSGYFGFKLTCFEEGQRSMDAVLQDWPDFMTSLHDLTCFGIPFQITKEHFEFRISKECFQASWLIQILSHIGVFMHINWKPGLPKEE